MKEEDLVKELEQRGTAEISDGVVNQVTQAVSENETDVEFLVFGEMRKQGIIPIEVACAKCDHIRRGSVRECQDFQGKDARARGFTQVICPAQFVLEEAINDT